MTAICWLAFVSTHDFLLYESSVGFGFCAAGWLHLVMDIMTPSGIPLLTPFGTCTSLNLYKTPQLEGCPRIEFFGKATFVLMKFMKFF